MFKYEYDDGISLRKGYSKAETEELFFEEINKLELMNKLIRYKKVFFRLPERPVFRLNEKVMFYKNLMGMLKAGIPKNEALISLTHTYSSKKQRRLLEEMAEGVEKGLFLSTIMKSYSTFGDEEIVLMSIGEESGNIDTALENLCEFVTYKQKSTSSMKTMLMYPLIFVVISYIAFCIGMIKIIPAFKEVINLDKSEKIVVDMFHLSDYISTIPIYGLIGVFVGALYLIYKSRKIIYKIFYELSYQIKPLRNIILQFENVKFITYFRVMYISGILPVNIFKSLKLNSYDRYKRVYEDIEFQVSTGKKIFECLDERYFIPLVRGGFMSGEQSGDLEENLHSMKDFLETQNDALKKRLFELMSPAMLLIMAILLSWAVVKIIIPMYFSLMEV